MGYLIIYGVKVICILFFAMCLYMLCEIANVEFNRTGKRIACEIGISTSYVKGFSCAKIRETLSDGTFKMSSEIKDGHWLHSCKDGTADLRYKNNPYIVDSYYYYVILGYGDKVYRYTTIDEWRIKPLANALTFKGFRYEPTKSN